MKLNGEYHITSSPMQESNKVSKIGILTPSTIHLYDSTSCQEINQVLRHDELYHYSISLSGNYMIATCKQGVRRVHRILEINTMKTIFVIPYKRVIKLWLSRDDKTVYIRKYDGFYQCKITDRYNDAELCVKAAFDLKCQIVKDGGNLIHISVNCISSNIFLDITCFNLETKNKTCFTIKNDGYKYPVVTQDGDAIVRRVCYSNQLWNARYYNQLISVTNGETIHSELMNKINTIEYYRDDPRVHICRMSRDGTLLASVHRDLVEIYDLCSSEKRLTIPVTTCFTIDLRDMGSEFPFSRDNKSIAIITDEKEVTVFSLQAKSKIFTIKFPEHVVTIEMYGSI